MSNEVKGHNGEEEFSESRKLILQMAATLMGRDAAQLNLEEFQYSSLVAAERLVSSTEPSDYIFLHNLFTREEKMPTNQIADRIKEAGWSHLKSKNTIDKLITIVEAELSEGMHRTREHAIDDGLEYISRNMKLSCDKITALDTLIEETKSKLLTLAEGALFIPSNASQTRELSNDFFNYLMVNDYDDISSQERGRSKLTLIRPYYFFFYCLYLAEHDRRGSSIAVKQFMVRRESYEHPTLNKDSGRMFHPQDKAPNMYNRVLYAEFWKHRDTKIQNQIEREALADERRDSQ